MRIVTQYSDLPDEDRGASVAIGNFDGVHFGHRTVIDAAKEYAKQHDIPLGVITFDPHPRRFFKPDTPEFRLMSLNAKTHELEKLGVGILYVLPFNKELSQLTAQEFAKDVLQDGLGVKHIVVGSDFKFGTNRSGDTNSLIDFGKSYGFDTSIAPLLIHGDTEISSTAIRKALSLGEVKHAADMLGHWHRIEGQVQHGEKRGRELGFPTANMSVDGLHLPKFGIYSAIVDVLDGPHEGRYPAAVSLGIRPTFGINSPNLESHLIGFDGDLYGANISVSLVSYLRPELKFNSLDELITQIGKDCDAATIDLSATFPTT